MLKMSQVTSIREQWSEGKTISEIARAVSVDRNTVYKYTQMTDFSKAVALYVPRGCMQGYKVKFITLSQLGYHSQKHIGTKARS